MRGTMTRLHAILTTLVFSIAVLSADAWALAPRPPADPNAPPPPAWVSWAPLLVMVLIFYFLLIRPQSRQRRERQALLDNLKKGDKIVTQGGIHATIVNVGPHFLDVKINEETKVRIQRSAVTDLYREPAEPAAVEPAAKN